MTARDDLYDALVVGDGRIETELRAKQLINAAIEEAIRVRKDLLHLTGRPAPGEFGYARDQLIVAFRGGEESEFHAYGWDTAVMMADRVVASMRVEVGRENAAKIRAAIRDLDLDDHWAVYYRAEDVEKLPDLIDPDKQEQP